MYINVGLSTRGGCDLINLKPILHFGTNKVSYIFIYHHGGFSQAA